MYDACSAGRRSMMATHRRRRRPVTRSLSIGGLHEIFLVSSIGMILIIRLQLWATNYPKLSSGRLHFAHLLWGGLLMLVAIGILLSFVDRRLRVPAAVLAGAGFGFFIDEVGKFVTSNRDYFFKPTGGDHLPDVHRRLLRPPIHPPGDHPLVPQLQALVQGAPTVPGPPPSPARRLVAWAERGYDTVSGEVWFQSTIVGIFFAYAVLNLSSILVIVFLIARYDLPVSVLVPATVSDIAQQVSELVSLVLIFAGLTRRGVSIGSAAGQVTTSSVTARQVQPPCRAPPGAARAGAARHRRGPEPAPGGRRRARPAFARGAAAVPPASRAGSGNPPGRGDRRSPGPPEAPAPRPPRRPGSAGQRVSR